MSTSRTKIDWAYQLASKFLSSTPMAKSRNEIRVLAQLLRKQYRRGLQDEIAKSREEVERLRKDKPKRIQRKRTKGWKMPPNTVYVGRPTKWGNPYKVTDCKDAQEAIELFQLDHECITLLEPLCADCRAWVNGIRAELRGQDLACWCPVGQPCHADVLLEIANAD